MMNTFLRVMLHIKYIQCNHHKHIPKVTLHTEYIQCNHGEHIPECLSKYRFHML